MRAVTNKDQEIAATLAQIDRAMTRLRRLLDTPHDGPTRRRPISLKDAALRALDKDWMTLNEWERGVVKVGYKPRVTPKREDQMRRSLASLAARNRDLIDADGRGNYRVAAPRG